MANSRRGPAIRAAGRQQLRVLGGLKLARLLGMRDEEMARMVGELEGDPLFARLRAEGVLSHPPLPRAAFAARRLAGRELSRDSGALGEVLDGRSDLVRLMRSVGAEKFEECFLKGERLSDAERARRSGISPEQARLLRELVDRLYIRSEFETPAPAPPRTYAPVAGIVLEDGAPRLSFFNREAWKGAYKIDERLLAEFRRRLSEDARPPLERFVRRLGLANLRQTSLHRALLAMVAAQAKYLKSGDPLDRQPLTQRGLAAALDLEASALHRLIANKAVELPWGTEAPLKSLLPSAKTLAKERLSGLIAEKPGLSDQSLREAMAVRHEVHLSRRSIAQYRKELGLAAGGRGRRVRR